MSSSKFRLLTKAGGIVAGAAALAYAAYRKDIEAARRRIADESQVIGSEKGPIEFGERGDGPAVLLIHGAAAASIKASSSDAPSSATTTASSRHRVSVTSARPFVPIARRKCRPMRICDCSMRYNSTACR